MTKLIITPNIELDPWTDLKDGAPYPGGVAETTWALFNGAARALAASLVADLDRREHGA